MYYTPPYEQLTPLPMGCVVSKDVGLKSHHLKSGTRSPNRIGRPLTTNVRTATGNSLLDCLGSFGVIAHLLATTVCAM